MIGNLLTIKSPLNRIASAPVVILLRNIFIYFIDGLFTKILYTFSVKKIILIAYFTKKKIYIASNGCFFLMICIYMYSIMWNVENALLFVCICYVIYVMDVCLFINSR